MTAHLPHLVNLLAFIAVVVALALGWVAYETHRARPAPDGYESSSDERFRLGCEQGAEKRGGRL